MPVDHWMTMPRNILTIYVEELPRLLAERQQMMITAASYPYMKQDEQRKVQDQLESKIKRRRHDPKAIDLSQLTEYGRKHFFNQLGIRFEEVDSDDA